MNFSSSVTLILLINLLSFIISSLDISDVIEFFFFSELIGSLLFVDKLSKLVSNAVFKEIGAIR
jgi:hypothetical protein